MPDAVSRTILVGAAGAGKAEVLNTLLQSEVFHPHRVCPSASSHTNPHSAREYVSLSLDAPRTPAAAAAVLRALLAQFPTSASTPTTLLLVSAPRRRAPAAALARFLAAATRQPPSVLATRAGSALQAAARGAGGSERLALLLGLPSGSAAAAAGASPDAEALAAYFTSLRPLRARARARLVAAVANPAALPLRAAPRPRIAPDDHVKNAVSWQTEYETVLLAGGGAGVRAVRAALLGRVAAQTRGRCAVTPGGRMVMFDVSDDEGVDTDGDGEPDTVASGRAWPWRKEKETPKRSVDVPMIRGGISHVLRRALGPVRVVLCVCLRRGWITSADKRAAGAVRAELNRHGMSARGCVSVVAVGAAADVAFVTAANSEGRVWDVALGQALFGERRRVAAAVAAAKKKEAEKNKDKGEDEESEEEEEEDLLPEDETAVKSLPLRQDEARAVIAGGGAAVITKRLREFVHETPTARVGTAAADFDDGSHAVSDHEGSEDYDDSDEDEEEDEEGEDDEDEGRETEASGSSSETSSSSEEDDDGLGSEIGEVLVGSKLLGEAGEAGGEAEAEAGAAAAAAAGGTAATAAAATGLGAAKAVSSAAWSSAGLSAWSVETETAAPSPWQSGDLFLCSSWSVR